MAGNKYADLSQECLWYIGGIIRHAKALNGFTNPSTNSYKRLVPGFEAPVLLAYSARNRSASCRIPWTSNPKAKRVEVRFPDPTANPYLAFAAMLMAGLDGIKNKIDPGPAMDKDLYDLPPKELKKIPTVCGSLREALANLDKDRAFLKAGDVFNDDFIDSYIDLKMADVQRLRDDAAPGRVRHVLQLLSGRARDGRGRPGRPFRLAGLTWIRRRASADDRAVRGVVKAAARTSSPSRTTARGFSAVLAIARDCRRQSGAPRRPGHGRGVSAAAGARRARRSPTIYASSETGRALDLRRNCGETGLILLQRPAPARSGLVQVRTSPTCDDRVRQPRGLNSAGSRRPRTHRSCDARCACASGASSDFAAL